MFIPFISPRFGDVYRHENATDNLRDRHELEIDFLGSKENQATLAANINFNKLQTRGYDLYVSQSKPQTGTFLRVDFVPINTQQKKYRIKIPLFYLDKLTTNIAKVLKDHNYPDQYSIIKKFTKMLRDQYLYDCLVAGAKLAEKEMPTLNRETRLSDQNSLSGENFELLPDNAFSKVIVPSGKPIEVMKAYTPSKLPKALKD